MSTRGRRRRSHKLRNTTVGGLGAIIAAALLWLHFGGGGGFFGTVGGWTSASGSGVVDAGATRCALRIDRSGLSLAGKPISVKGAVSACRHAGAADMVVTGDANYGLFQRARAALKAAGIAVYVR